MEKLRKRKLKTPVSAGYGVRLPPDGVNEIGLAFRVERWPVMKVNFLAPSGSAPISLCGTVMVPAEYWAAHTWLLPRSRNSRSPTCVLPGVQLTVKGDRCDAVNGCFRPSGKDSALWWAIKTSPPIASEST